MRRRDSLALGAAAAVACDKLHSGPPTRPLRAIPVAQSGDVVLIGEP